MTQLSLFGVAQAVERCWVCGYCVPSGGVFPPDWHADAEAPPRLVWCPCCVALVEREYAWLDAEFE